MTTEAKPKKRKKSATTTPVARITNMLRRIWLWSPERTAVVKRAGGKCEECECELSKTAKEFEKTGNPRLEIHHVEPVDMTELAKLIHRRLFPGADGLDCLCRSCHGEAEAIAKREKDNFQIIG